MAQEVKRCSQEQRTGPQEEKPVSNPGPDWLPCGCSHLEDALQEAGAVRPCVLVSQGALGRRR